MKLLATFWLVLIVGCAMETGRVIEISVNPSAGRAVLVESLSSVGAALGMVIEGPEAGPGGIAEYRARYRNDSSTMDFYLSLQVGGGQPSIVVRTLNSQRVDPALAERALELLRAELDLHHLKYSIRRTLKLGQARFDPER